MQMGVTPHFGSRPRWSRLLPCWCIGLVAMDDSDHRPRRNAEDKSMWLQAAEVGSVGIEMGLAVAVGYFGGKWLDAQFGTAPYLFYFMMFSGVGAAFKALWRIAAKTRRQLGSDAERDEPGKPGDDSGGSGE